MRMTTQMKLELNLKINNKNIYTIYVKQKLQLSYCSVKMRPIDAAIITSDRSKLVVFLFILLIKIKEGTQTVKSAQASMTPTRYVFRLKVSTKIDEPQKRVRIMKTSRVQRTDIVLSDPYLQRIKGLTFFYYELCLKLTIPAKSS